MSPPSTRQGDALVAPPENLLYPDRLNGRDTIFVFLAFAAAYFCSALLRASMLVTFWSWGMVNPWLARQGWHATRLITWGMPLSMIVLAFNILGGASTGSAGWALFCVTSSVMGLAQPAVGMSFRAALAGRALSAYNLVIFVGVFFAQWSLGRMIDGFAAMGLTQVASFQPTMAVFLCCCIAAYVGFLSMKADNSPQ